MVFGVHLTVFMLPFVVGDAFTIMDILGSSGLAMFLFPRRVFLVMSAASLIKSISDDPALSQDGVAVRDEDTTTPCESGNGLGCHRSALKVPPCLGEDSSLMPLPQVACIHHTML